MRCNIFRLAAVDTCMKGSYIVWDHLPSAFPPEIFWMASLAHLAALCRRSGIYWIVVDRRKLKWRVAYRVRLLED